MPAPTLRTPAPGPGDAPPEAPASPLRRVATRLQLRACERVGKSVVALGRVWVHGTGRVLVGDGVRLDGREAPIELHAHGRAEIRIGGGATIGPGASLEAVSLISIGERAEIGPFCKVLDSHHHGLRLRPLATDRTTARLARERAAASPVVVEPGAVLGARAILLPGANVRAGARVAPGTVVSRSGRGPGPAAAPGVAAPDPAPRTRIGRVVRGAVLLAGGVASFGRVALRTPVCVRGRVRVVNRGRLAVGAGVHMLGGMIRSQVICHPGASLSIGARCDFNYGVFLEATRSVRIGSRCMFGSLVHVADGGPGGPLPIEIGDDVWIAHGAVIRPGVSVGDRCVVAAGTVVDRDVPADHLAIGRPLRVVPLRLFAS